MLTTMLLWQNRPLTRVNKIAVRFRTQKWLKVPFPYFGERLLENYILIGRPF